MSGTSPYLSLPLRSEDEVRRARMLSETLDRIARPTPAQRWLESIGPKLEQFRKEDEGRS